ncbi:MAG: hypothetical protein OJF49_004563 [Ktedonobacterales bacterium]|nr:MAG: hypothetical protein OJF49_004563 [Ktedonobacterales bacterium]
MASAGGPIFLSFIARKSAESAIASLFAASLLQDYPWQSCYELAPPPSSPFAVNRKIDSIGNWYAQAHRPRPQQT